MSDFAGSSICNSFKVELLSGVHNFAMDTFRLALYGPQALLSEHTTNYVQLGELLPLNGYAAGGRIVTVDPPLLSGRTAIVPFSSVVWQPASFRARKALCYNASKPGLPAVFVLDFGAEREANGTNFTVRFPGPDPHAAIVRLTS